MSTQPATPSADGTRTLVLPLDRLGRGDLAVVGGKGANLGELIRAGFPVPAGYVVTTAAYDRAVAEKSLAGTIEEALRAGREGGAPIRRAFEGAPMPEAVEQEVLAAYRQIGKGAVAVRSSATAEDLPEAAFAGQQDTFLNVVGSEAPLDAVRRCWASLWTDRAIAYRERQVPEQATVKLAVVVQRMVEAEAAGVLFTANPVTGARNEIIIDANPGLGEAVVSGLVAPDHFVLRRQWWGWRVTQRRIGRREVIVRTRSGGGTEHVEGPAATADAPAVPASALRRLARLGAGIERHFGSPQDVEWAWADGTPVILQARPITALPEPLLHPSRLVRFQAAIFAELLPVRSSPLEATPLVDPRLYRQTAGGGGALLSGTPGSPGVAEGPVCVIRDSSQFGKLRPAEVLVAPYTNPAWTPLFERAAAVVADSGGPASHAAIVAREYGIPAVMGTVDGTRQLRDGERVRVDGDEGLVFRVPSAADDDP